jgi:hypothetical protein
MPSAWSFSTLAVTPTDNDEAFLREVDEGVRRDQVLSLWQRFGKIGITLLVLGLALLAGFLWWRDQAAVKAGVVGEEFSRASDQLDVGEGARARPTLERIVKDGPGGYAPLAQMVLASDAVAAGDAPRAIKLLDSIAADDKVPQPLRDAALLKSVRLGFDAQPPAKTIARLKPLVVPGTPWFSTAAEMTALAQLKAGNPEAAKPLLTAIVIDTNNPPGMRGRTAQLALSLGVDERLLKLRPGEAGGAAATPAPAASPAPAAAPAPKG